MAQFKKGAISKISPMGELDMKKIGTIAIIAAGVICGLVLLMQ
jgi:hypothetical protein